MSHFVIFHQFLSNLKLTCLVTLFDRKHNFSKKIAKLSIFGIFNEVLSTQNVKEARFAHNVDIDFFWHFQTLCALVIIYQP